MEDQDFVNKLKEKIQRLTGEKIVLHVNTHNKNDISIEFNGSETIVNMGNNIYEYSGFARMCVEYAVASITEQRPIDVLEFHVLLARN
ncbi:MAG TPA: hypothetical protein DEZ08_04375 [Dehalococcoidia bacterium]|nr:hypothetical protein [Dehalococcoidia bacterium]